MIDFSAKPVRRLDLVREVVERLRTQIIAGAFGVAGALPPEGQLSQAFGVSRTVIREAMRILGTMGLVDVSQGKTPRVKPADSSHVVDSLTIFLQRADHSLLHLVEVRRHLETTIAALAAQRASPDQIEAMEQEVCKLETRGTLANWVDADLCFHSLLAEATGNPVFAMLLTPLTHLMRLSQKQTLGRTGVVRAVAGHQEILAAVRHGDVVGAQQAMLDHLHQAEQDLGGIKTVENAQT